MRTGCGIGNDFVRPNVGDKACLVSTGVYCISPICDYISNRSIGPLVDKYKNKYRIPSARAQWWDYGWQGSYFITICTKLRRHFFGRVTDEIMELSALGRIADKFWCEIPYHAKNIELGPHVVMPNHVHGILNLHSHAEPFMSVSAMPPASNAADQYDEFAKTIGQMRFQNPGKNTISTIVGAYKSAVSKDARKQESHFAWQSRFHDHIIRNAEEYQRIANYILSNPANWKGDKFNR